MKRVMILLTVLAISLNLVFAIQHIKSDSLSEKQQPEVIHKVTSILIQMRGKAILPEIIMRGMG